MDARLQACESAIRAHRLTEASLDRRQAERAEKRPLPDLLLAKGAMEPPAPITRPSRARLALRRAVARACRWMVGAA